MGGNYRTSEVPHLPEADRMPSSIYYDLCDRLESYFRRSGVNAVIPSSIREKVSHGDIDLVIPSSQAAKAREAMKPLTWRDPETNQSYLEQLQHPDSQNSYICSFYSKAHDMASNVQVDLVIVPDEEVPFAVNYFSWNDAGNLIGRIAHRRGLKFGWDGLVYVHRDGSNKLGEFKLPLSFHQALEYLGFDPWAWMDGFDTFEELFNWVKSSEFFEPCAYPLEHQNHRARTRDRKRATYNAFLEWLGYEGEYFEADKKTPIEQMRKDFPEIDEQIKAADAHEELRKQVKSKVNGITVSKYLEAEGISVSGKELGKVMRFVKVLLPISETTLRFSQQTINDTIDLAYRMAHEVE